jgi:hypothetical protein
MKNVKDNLPSSKSPKFSFGGQPRGAEDRKKQSLDEYKVEPVVKGPEITRTSHPRTLMAFLVILLGVVAALNFGLQGSLRIPWISQLKPVIITANAQDLWCGKPYKAGSPGIPVEGQFPVPTMSKQPLLGKPVAMNKWISQISNEFQIQTLDAGPL